MVGLLMAVVVTDYRGLCEQPLWPLAQSLPSLLYTQRGRVDKQLLVVEL